MRSDLMKKGLERAPHRSLYKAMGYTDEELSRPMIGVVNSANEIIPGHVHLNVITEDAKAGIRMAGGTPVTFPVIGVCDGIAMGHTGMKYSWQAGNSSPIPSRSWQRPTPLMDC